MQNRNAIRLLAAMLQGRHAHQGTIAMQSGPMDVTSAVQEIAEALDWRVEKLEAPRMNLNDLEHPESPLSRTVRHAVSSDLTYVLILRDFRPEALEDDEYVRKLARLASMVKVVLSMDGPPARTRGWRLADLRN